MTQHLFDFTPKPNPETILIQQWVEKHNSQVISAARTPTHGVGTLMSALDSKETASNSVYMLRCILGQQLRKSLTPGPSISKKRFMKSLMAEILIKRTGGDPVFVVRNTIMNIS